MSGATNLEAALDLAHRGGMVLLVCWPDDNGQCACPGLWDGKRMAPHQGKDIGKAPFAKGGYTAATSDPEQISQLWTKYPKANVGLWLEGSGMAAIDPDSELAAAEAHKHGMPPRPVRHSRYRAFLFALPDGCPIERSIHGGSDGKLDILSEGLLVAHGRHQNGHAVWIDWGTLTELQPLPAWAVQRLVARDAERNASKGPIGKAGEPTALSEREVIERAKANTKRGALFTALYDDGAPNLIGACTCEPVCATVCPHKPICTERRCPAKCMVTPYPSESERDLALMNMIRFWGGNNPERMELLFGFSAPGKRPKWQGSASYRKATVARALAGKVWKPASDGPDLTPLEQIETSGNDGAEGCQGCAELRAERDYWKRIALRLQDEDAGRKALRSSKWAGQERIALEHLGQRVVDARRNGRGEVKLFLEKEAEQSGVPKATYSRVIKRLEDIQTASKDYPVPLPFRIVRGETQNKLPQIRLQVEPGSGSLGGDYRLLASLPQEDRATPGGRKPGCPDHPHAKLKVRRIVTCTVCDFVVDDNKRRPTYITPSALEEAEQIAAAAVESNPIMAAIDQIRARHIGDQPVHDETADQEQDDASEAYNWPPSNSSDRPFHYETVQESPPAPEQVAIKGQHYETVDAPGVPSDEPFHDETPPRVRPPAYCQQCRTAPVGLGGHYCGPCMAAYYEANPHARAAMQAGAA